MSAEWQVKGPDDLKTVLDVSHETIHRLTALVALLVEWQKRMNLVSAASLNEVWQRHVADSAQLAALIPAEAKTLVDLGSGAGFPGLVLAILLSGQEGFKAHLIESTGKKCDFLRTAIEATKAPAKVHQGRIEETKRIAADVITARACAPLSELLSYAKRFATPHSLCVFPKGKGAEAELTQVQRSWRIAYKLVPSRTDPASRIIVVRGLLDARR